MMQANYSKDSEETGMQRFKLISTAILVLLGVIIILQNTEAVETRILFFSITMPRAILLMGTVCIGFALGILVSFFAKRKDTPPDLP
jgi:putative membrane protein